MLYNLAIVIYDFIVHLAAPFSRKPRKMMKGHWVVYELLRQQVEKGEQYIWFHAASLGEFEQGRPLIEMIRAKYPAYKISLQTDDKPVLLIIYSCLIFTNIAEIPTNPQKTIEAIIIANDFLKQLGDLYPNLKVSLPIFN